MTKDADIWDAYKRAVTPAKKKVRSIAAKPAPEKSAARKSAVAAPKLPKITAATKVTDTTLERRREKALRGGDVDIDAKLDLHGMTQIQAFEALTSFMERKAKAGKRHLLIITGKGTGGAGVLRGNLHTWLGQLPEAKKILAVRAAAPKHGGDGAFYVLLRKS